MSDGLRQVLQDLLQQRRKECLKRGWSQVPEQVFCSQAGTHLDERNVNRVWDRIRRKAQKGAVRPLRLHDCRHTWATWLYSETRDLRLLMELGGWKTIAMVERYIHVNPDHLRPAIDSLPDGAKSVQGASPRKVAL